MGSVFTKFILSFLLSLVGITCFYLPGFSQNQPLPCLEKTFSVVVHIIREENGNLGINNFAIQQNINKLNEAFLPICVNFEICETNVVENYQYDNLDNLTTTEWEELRNLYHRNNRINIFFIRRFEDQNLCGLATPGGISDMANSGIALSKRNNCIGNNLQSISHFMGLFFGLNPTYEGGGELVDGSNCNSSGDQLCDTPADPFEAGDNPDDYIDGNCRFNFGGQDSNGEYYVTDAGNIMSEYLGCRCRFSFEQYRLMAENYLLSPEKMW